MIPLSVSEFFYQGVSRWDFGLENPNKTAVLLAFLLLLLLVVILRTRRRWILWCSTALAIPLGYAFVHTFSRGGFVALLAGAAVIFMGRWREMEKSRWIPLLVVVMLLTVSAVWIGFAGRLAASVPSADMSVGNRLMVWRTVPNMMVDAPGGWGRGNAGTAFMGWYQPLSRQERYRTLVSSHFTWLVECGWCGRWMIVIGWMSVMGLGLLRLKRNRDPLPLSLWVCFWTAASFSSVAEDWYAWIIPVGALLPTVKTFFAPASAMTRRRMVCMVIAGGSLLTGAVAAWSLFRPQNSIVLHRTADGKRIVLGEGEPAAWIVLDESIMGGPCYGRTLRAFAQSSAGQGRAFGIASDLAAVPKAVRHLVLCGRSADRGPTCLGMFAKLKEVRILSPARPLDWLAAQGHAPMVQVICGDLSPNCPSEDVEGLRTISGVGDYLPAWPLLAFGNLDGVCRTRPRQDSVRQ